MSNTSLGTKLAPDNHSIKLVLALLGALLKVITPAGWVSKAIVKICFNY